VSDTGHDNRLMVEVRVQYLFVTVHCHGNQIFAGQKLNMEWATCRLYGNGL